MNKLQKYYTKAIRGRKTVSEMKTSVMAIFHHCTSTDEKPNHEGCPEGLDSWCFFQRALARSDPPPYHKDKLSCFLAPEVAVYVKDVYDRMSEDDLLSRCLEGKTQNANESLHSLLWSRCPKHIFANRRHLETALSIGIVEFNQGSAATQKFLQCLCFNIGMCTKKIGTIRDRKQLYNAEYALLESTTSRKEIQDKAKIRRRGTLPSRGREGREAL